MSTSAFRSRSGRHQAFTLIELLVVIAIIAILAFTTRHFWPLLLRDQIVSGSVFLR